MTVLRKFSDNKSLCYGKGAFDTWCVYLEGYDGAYKAVRDIEYFSVLKKLGKKHGPYILYQDFVNLYESTGKSIDRNVWYNIVRMSGKYGEDSVSVDKVFSVLYAGMVAEENKEGTRLGKRIKRLGVHMLLCEDRESDFAANYSRNRGWREISDMCSMRGF
jgi:hypothetical protein